VTRFAVALALVLASGAGPAAGAPEGASVRLKTQRALALSTPSERASALGRAFDGQDSADAAQAAVDLVFGKGEIFGRDEQLPLDAAVFAVARMADKGVVPVLAAGAKSGPQARRLRCLEALGRSCADGAAAALAEFLGDPDVEIRAAATTEAGRRSEPVCAGRVELALSDPEWTVRSAAASSLARMGSRAAVPALVAAMRTGDGRAADDCVFALAAITGRRFGPDPGRYEAWWAKEQGKEAPTAAPWTAPPLSFDTPLFDLRSRRVLFILATGDTMKDAVGPAATDKDVVAAVRAAGKDLAQDLAAAKTKLDVARVHLRTMLRTLKDGVLFDVIAYSGSASEAFGRITPADATSRKHAESRIASLSASGFSNVHGALVRAFGWKPGGKLDDEAGPDTIVLFSDGAVGAPGSTDPTEIVQSIARLNAVRQIRVLVVATGQCQDGILGRLAAGPPLGGVTTLP
jgi:hypothetical protein